MKKNNHIWGIDIFRGGAALLVFLFHYYAFFSPEISSDFFGISLFQAGHLGVDMFFVLSGFLVTLSLFSSENFWGYAEKRIRRIVPLAFAVLLAIFVLKQGFSGQNFLDLGVHLLFLQGFFSEFYHSMNPVMWTLSVEMLFYLVLPFVWLVLAKKNIHKFLIISGFLVFLSFIWRIYLFYIFQESPEISDISVSVSEKIFLSEQLWGRFDQFFLGMVLAVIIKKQINIFSVFSVFSASVQKILWNVILLSGVLMFFTGYYLFADLGSLFRGFFLGQVFLHALVGLGFFLFLLWFIQAQYSFSKRVRRIFAPLIFSGKISYGIYLFHFPVLSLVHKLAHQYSDVFFLSSSYFHVFSFSLALVLTLFLSFISYQFFEIRFLKKY